MGYGLRWRFSLKTVARVWWFLASSQLVAVGLCVADDAATLFKDKDSVIAQYVQENQGPYSVFPVTPETVHLEVRDIDGNGSMDLMLYDKNRCGRETGCLDDIYLCSVKSPHCEGGEYCYAGRTYSVALDKKRIWSCRAEKATKRPGPE